VEHRACPSHCSDVAAEEPHAYASYATRIPSHWQALCLHTCGNFDSTRRGGFDTFVCRLAASHPSLTALELPGFDLSDKAVCALAAGCPLLETLVIGSTVNPESDRYKRTTDASVHALRTGCPCLRRLNVRACTSLTPPALAELTSALPQLVVEGGGRKELADSDQDPLPSDGSATESEEEEESGEDSSSEEEDDELYELSHREYVKKVEGLFEALQEGKSPNQLLRDIPKVGGAPWYLHPSHPMISWNHAMNLA
jgi:hypothetical protein